MSEKKEPYEKLEQLDCMMVTVFELTKCVGESVDDVKTEQARIKDLVKVWDDMLTRVKDQKARVNAAHMKLKKAAEFEAAKIADMAAKNKQVDKLGAAKIELVKDTATRKAALSGNKATTIIFNLFDIVDKIEHVKAFSSFVTIDT